MDRVRPGTVALLLTCASCRPPPARLDPLAFLAVGVEPSTEARNEERALEARGYRIEARVDGSDFIALGAATVGRARSAVRVLTRRGIAFGVDAPSRDRPGWQSVELLEGVSGRDLDHDDLPELVVRLRDTSRFEPCLVILRVRDVGDVFEVPIDTRAHGERACVEGIMDVERDGSPELMVGYRPWRVPGAPVPVVEVPYQGHDGTYAPAPEGVLAALVPEAVAARAERRVHAVASGDGRERVKLTLEIAWYERAEAGTSAVGHLDDALRDVTLDDATARLVATARADLGEP